MAFTVRVGAAGSGTTTLTCPVPTAGNAPVSGDLMLIQVESSNSTTAVGTPSTPAGWTSLSENSGNVGATGVTTHTIFGKIAGAGETDVTVTGFLDHGNAQMIVISGHGVSNLATDVIIGANATGAATAGSNSQAITVLAGSAVFIMVAYTTDAISTTSFSGWTNANLSAPAEIIDNGISTGAGGAIGTAWGTCAGTTSGTSTWTGPSATRYDSIHLGVPLAAAGPTNAELSAADPNYNGLGRVSAFLDDEDAEHYDYYSLFVEHNEAFIAGPPAGGGGPSDAELAAADPNYNGLGRVSAFLDDEDAEVYDYYASAPSTLDIAPWYQSHRTIVWLDASQAFAASADGAAASTFPDASGNGNAFTSSTGPSVRKVQQWAAFEPKAVVFNPSRTGVTSYYDGPSLANQLTGQVTLLIVFRPGANQQTENPVDYSVFPDDQKFTLFANNANDSWSVDLGQNPHSLFGPWRATRLNGYPADGFVPTSGIHLLLLTVNASGVYRLFNELADAGDGSSGFVFDLGDRSKLLGTDPDPQGQQRGMTGYLAEMQILNWEVSPVERQALIDATVTKWLADPHAAVASILEPTADLEHDDHDYWSQDHAPSLDVSAFVAGPPVVASDAYIAALDLPDHTDQPDEDEAFDFYGACASSLTVDGFLAPHETDAFETFEQTPGTTLTASNTVFASSAVSGITVADLVASNERYVDGTSLAVSAPGSANGLIGMLLKTDGYRTHNRFFQRFNVAVSRLGSSLGFTWWNPPNGVGPYVGVDATGHVVIFNGNSAAVATSSLVITPEQFFRVEILWTRSGAVSSVGFNMVVSIYLDPTSAVADETVTALGVDAAGTIGGDVTGPAVGIATFGVGQAGSLGVWIDDYAISTKAFPAPTGTAAAPGAIPSRIATASWFEQETTYQADPDEEHHNWYSQRFDGAVEAFIAGAPVADDSYVATIDVPDASDQPDEDEAWDYYDPFIDGAEAILGFLTVEDEIANAAQLDAAAGQDDDAWWTLTDPTDIAPFVEQAEAIVGFLTVEDEVAEAAQLDRSVGQDDDQAWLTGDPTDVAPFIDGAEAILGFLTIEDEIAEAAQLPRDIGWFSEDFDQANDPTDITPFLDEQEELIAGPPLFADDGYVATVDVFDHSDEPTPDDAFDFYATTQEGTEWLIGFLAPDVEIAIGAQPSRGEDTGLDNPDWDYTDDQPYVEQTEAVIGFLAPDAEIAEAAQLDRSVGQDDDQAWIVTDPTDVWPFTDQAEWLTAGSPITDDFIASAASHVESVTVDFPDRIDDTEEQSVETVQIQPEENVAGSTAADDPLYLAQLAPDLGWSPDDYPEYEPVSIDAAGAITVSVVEPFAPPTLPVADTFTRADSTLLGSTEIGGASWREDAGDWQIVSGQLIPVASGAAQYATVDVGSTDHVAAVDAVGATDHAYVVARFVDTNNLIVAGWQQAATDVTLFKEVGGVFTQVGLFAAGVHGGRLTLWIEGDNVTVYVNDVPRITYTIADAILRTGTRVGVLTSAQEAFDNLNVVTPSGIVAAAQLPPRDDESGLYDWDGFDYAQLDAVSSLDVSAYTAGPPVAGDDSIATTALVPDASDQPAPDDAWDGWAYPVEASEWFIGFTAPDAGIADAAQDHTTGQDDDQLWTLTDPTDAAPFVDGIEYLTGFLVPADEIAQAAQPHYGDWQDWREAEQTEDYANDSTIGVEDTTNAPDTFDLTAAAQPDPSIGQDWHLWPEWDYTADQPYASELDVAPLTFPADSDEVTQAAQPTAIGQDDDALWTLTDPTDIAPFTEQAEGFIAGPPDAFDTTIATQPDPSMGQDTDLLNPPDLSQLDTGYLEQAEGYVAGPPAFAPDAEAIASQPAETGIDVEGRWPEWDGTDATPFLDGAEWFIGFTVPDVEITIAAQPSRAEDTAIDDPDRIEWTEETDPASALDISSLVRADDPIEVTLATQLDASVGQDDDQWWTLLDPTDTTPFIDEQEEAIAGSTPADDPLYAAQAWPDVSTTEYAPEETQDYANDSALDLSPLVFPPDAFDLTIATQLDPSAGQDDDQGWIAADPTDIWPFTDQLEAFEEIVTPDEGIAATQDYSDAQYEPEALWAPESLSDGSTEFIASDIEQALLPAATALCEPAAEPEDEAWPLYVPLADQSGEFAATQLDIALVAALDVPAVLVDEPEPWYPEVALSDGVEQVAVTAETAVTVAAQPTFDAYDWSTFEEPVADLSTIERRPIVARPTAQPDIVPMVALVDPGVDLVALKDPEVGFPTGGGFSSGFSSGFQRGGGSGELDALAESEGYAMGPYGAPAPDHVSAREGEVEHIDALSDPEVDVT